MSAQTNTARFHRVARRGRAALIMTNARRTLPRRARPHSKRLWSPSFDPQCARHTRRRREACGEKSGERRSDGHEDDGAEEHARVEVKLDAPAEELAVDDVDEDEREDEAR